MSRRSSPTARSTWPASTSRATATWAPSRPSGSPRCTPRELDESWGQVVDDPTLAARWASLEQLPVGTVGRGVADFYRDRGFVYPGRPGSAPPLLAQHDWAHVLAGYGTSLENEIEVFAFIARTNDDPRAFSLLAMVVSLFETGYLAAGAGLFEADPGHLAAQGMATRLADAMRRGAMTTGSTDLLDLDWFAIADRPVDVVRGELGLTGKAPEALAAGSAGPWEPGGITEYQLGSARQAAAPAGSTSRGDRTRPGADPSRRSGGSVGHSPSLTSKIWSATRPCASRWTVLAASADGASTRQKICPWPSSTQYRR